MKPMHSGQVALLGRPNTGKSTLLNALVGERIAIVTHKPQTTRHRIAGIVTRPDGQAVFLDTPGLHKQRGHALNRRLNRIASDTSRGVDVIVMLVDATHWTDEDERVLELIQTMEGVPRILAFNKIDLLTDRAELLEQTARLNAILQFDAVVYVSAHKRKGLERLLDEVFRLLPEGEPLYEADLFTDRSERFLAAELVREQLMLQLHQEIPYGITVTIEQFKRSPQGVEIHALILVASERHKGMVIGRGGEVLKRVGTRARERMVRLFDERVHLELHVKTRRDWMDDEAALDELGYHRQA